MTQTPPSFGRPFQAALVLAFLAAGSLARAQDEDEPDDAVQVQQRAMQVNVWTDENFDQWIYNGRDITGIRGRLASLLILQIEDVERTCGLTEDQKKKLQLAGQGDVKHFFDRVAEKKRRFQLVKNDQNKIGQIFQEIQPLQTALATGPFDHGSIFYKTILKTLDPPQAAKYTRSLREKTAFRYRAKVELVIANLDESIGLRADQRKKLVALITEETRPPKRYGQYDYYIVMLQASRLPESALKPIFTDTQWKVMQRQMAQVVRLEPFLKSNGFVPEDEPTDRPPADAGENAFPNGVKAFPKN
ncbi:MAG: hypothetical protein JWN86_1114 [Planctomycetota bacterium]|nr:hypothetical protein [Planctomycetota bacterium]